AFSRSSLAASLALTAAMRPSSWMSSTTLLDCSDKLGVEAERLLVRGLDEACSEELLRIPSWFALMVITLRETWSDARRACGATCRQPVSRCDLPDVFRYGEPAAVERRRKSVTAHAILRSRRSHAHFAS